MTLFCCMAQKALIHKPLLTSKQVRYSVGLLATKCVFPFSRKLETSRILPIETKISKNRNSTKLPRALLLSYTHFRQKKYFCKNLPKSYVIQKFSQKQPFASLVADKLSFAYSVINLKKSDHLVISPKFSPTVSRNFRQFVYFRKQFVRKQQF